jgi:hypothetical protein
MILASVSGIAGLAAGVAVTLALRFSPKWNAPIIEQGEPIMELPGATRVGDHALRQRHRELVGRRITVGPGRAGRADARAPGGLRRRCNGRTRGDVSAGSEGEDQLQRLWPRS